MTEVRPYKKPPPLSPKAQATKDRHNKRVASVELSVEQINLIHEICAERRKTKSEVLREIIALGLSLYV